MKEIYNVDDWVLFKVSYVWGWEEGLIREINGDLCTILSRADELIENYPISELRESPNNHDI